MTANADAATLADLDVSRVDRFQANTHWPYFARLRRDDPVHFCRDSAYGPYWSITRYDDILAVEVNHRQFSSNRNVIIGDVPAEFDDPMCVDFDRTASAHSAFGNGVHRCPGASLAHLELEIAVNAWLTSIPEFEIDPLHPPRMRGGILSAVLSVGLRWEVATTRGAGARHRT